MCKRFSAFVHSGFTLVMLLTQVLFQAEELVDKQRDLDMPSPEAQLIHVSVYMYVCKVCSLLAKE